jgi:hypothetical protein
MTLRSRRLETNRSRDFLFRLQCKVQDSAFKSELLPLHSPLLRQSLLVSFPPLIDMLKFSGYPRLIRGQLVKKFEANQLQVSHHGWSIADNIGILPTTVTQIQAKLDSLMTLEQAYSSEYQGVQCAFKNSMIHGILQFTLFIAFRCVLHRCWNQEIRC